MVGCAASEVTIGSDTHNALVHTSMLQVLQSQPDACWSRATRLVVPSPTGLRTSTGPRTSVSVLCTSSTPSSPSPSFITSFLCNSTCLPLPVLSPLAVCRRSVENTQRRTTAQRRRCVSSQSLCRCMPVDSRYLSPISWVV